MKVFRMHLAVVFATGMALFFFGNVGFSAEGSFDYKHGFQGVSNCKKCHNRSKTGKQYDAWKKSKHAEAYDLLGTPKAKEVAKKAGVKGSPQKADECLVCHSTAFGASKDLLDKKFDTKDGVQCERCHGPGADYYKIKTMKTIAKEFKASGGKSSKTADEKGLVKADEKVCLECHSKSVTYKGKTYTNPTYSSSFNFAEAFKKIQHPNPAK